MPPDPAIREKGEKDILVLPLKVTDRVNLCLCL